MTVPLQLGGIVGLLDGYGQLVAVAGWVFYQIYWPFWETKMQAWFGSIHTRLIAIETIQIALARVIGPIDEEFVEKIHDRNEVGPNDVINTDRGNKVVQDDFFSDGSNNE